MCYCHRPGKPGKEPPPEGSPQPGDAYGLADVPPAPSTNTGGSGSHPGPPTCFSSSKQEPFIGVATSDTAPLA